MVRIKIVVVVVVGTLYLLYLSSDFVSNIRAINVKELAVLVVVIYNVL